MLDDFFPAILIVGMICSGILGFNIGSGLAQEEFSDHCVHGTTFMVNDIKYECKEVAE